MKAVMYDGPHQMHVTQLPEPSPGEGEVKLRVGACGICGSDVHGYTGESGRRVPGMVMGHEFAGEIVQLGSGVSNWSVGQRVAAFNIVAEVEPPPGAAGPAFKVIGVNMGTIGAFAEYICVPARNLALLKDDVSYPIALLNEPLAVSYHALRQLPAGIESLVIVGGGTIGQCLVRVARVMGLPRVFVLEPIQEKRELAEKNGAVALPSDLAELKKYLPKGADAAIEAVGVEKTLHLGIDSLCRGGTIILLGNLAKHVSIPLQHISSTEKKLVGTYGFNLDDFRQIVAWINEGRFDLDGMISGECSLDETPQVFADLASGKRQAVKIVVTP